MKNKFLLVGALLGVLTMSGCKDKKEEIKPTLSTPNQIDVRVDKGKSFIVFDEVPGAEYYNISINGNIVTVRANGTGEIQFDATRLLGESKDYEIKVNAGGKNCFDSQFTDIYTYTPERAIDAPIVAIDGTTLNWEKVAEADVYEVYVTTPTSEQKYRTINNSFGFGSVLDVCGEYVFYVKAINQDVQTVISVPSNQITYIHTETLITPHNLKVEYDYSTNEEVLTFVSSERVDEFEININNQSFSVSTGSSYWKESGFDNVYLFRIKAFASSHGISMDNCSLINVKVKAKSTQTYLHSSQYSQNATYQTKSILAQPTIAIKQNGSLYDLTISTENSEHLSQFVIYINNQEYKRINASIKTLQIPNLSKNDTICVQSISNNNNCYNSILSQIQVIDGTLEIVKVGYEENLISWEAIVGATGYWVEISNSRYRKCVTLEGKNNTTLDISTVCEPGKYTIRVIALGCGADGGVLNVEYCQNLETPKNLKVDRDNVCLGFDLVPNADGYVLTVGTISTQSQVYSEKTIPYLFTSSPIDISDYLIEAQEYEFKIQAIDLLNKYIDNSELTEGNKFENVKTISVPTLKLLQQGEEYYLQIKPKDKEAELIDKYEIWIDYVKFDGLVLENNRIRVTEHLQNAGLHNFRVKALAIESNFVRDSAITSIQYSIFKQLNNVSNIEVSHPADSEYILTFDGPIMAGGYNVKIIRDGDATYDVEFPSTSSVVDITGYIRDDGRYTIYVQALARKEDEYYRNSEVSAYTLIKGSTLQPVQNIRVTKDNAKDEINLTWDSVENSTSYKVQVYYNTSYGKVLKQTFSVPQSNNPLVKLVSANNIAVDKEGAYTIEIKAIGNNVYESSTVATGTYNHQMETIGDFERNRVFIEGNNYTYKVENVETLKNLLWYHYLYNQTWADGVYNYNLRVYCDLDLDELAKQVGGIEEDVENASVKIQKMNIIATKLLNQYKETLSYVLEYSSICLSEQDNIFLFNYQSNVENVQGTATSEVSYGGRLNTVDKNRKRLSSYIFNIDKQDSVDVTTTEQLFMALQYNKKPNFVGDSEVAEAVYENARYILRQLCYDEMTEYDKVLNIYEFLTRRVAWNYEAENKLTKVNDSANIQELYLESILYNAEKANGLFSTISESFNNNQVSNLNEFIGVSSLSQGLAKAFVALCSIEGIDCIKVNGILDNKDYSWNKVYIDANDDGVKEWYAIDLGADIKNKIEISGDEYQIGMHRYFLVEDSTIKAQEINCHSRSGISSYKAETSFDYYETQTYQGSNYEVKMTIGKDEDVANIIKHVMLTGGKQKNVIDVYAVDYLKEFITGSTINEMALKNAIATCKLEVQNELSEVQIYTLSYTIIENEYIIFAFNKPNS